MLATIKKAAERSDSEPAPHSYAATAACLTYASAVAIAASTAISRLPGRVGTPYQCPMRLRSPLPFAAFSAKRYRLDIFAADLAVLTVIS